MFIKQDISQEQDIEEKSTDISHIIWPIVIEILLAALLFFKSRSAAMSYLYALIPLLLVTAILGTYIYNRNGDMKLFSSVAMLSAIGTAFQIYVDYGYNPPNSFSLIKLLISLGAAVIFVLFYRMFRKILNRTFTVYFMMAVAALIYIVLIVLGVDPNGYGTNAWISIAGYTIQLTDFTKVAAVMFYAALFSSRTSRSDTQILVLSNLFFAINLIGSMFIHELGSFFILFFLHLSILFIFMQRGMTKRIYLLSVFFLTIGAIGITFVLWRLWYSAYDAGTMNSIQSALWPFINKIHTRFSITANINSDPYGAGYQLLQGKRALWMAGLFGNSVNFNAIPVVESDMAFIGLINSFGLLLGLFVVILFMRILMRGSSLSIAIMKKEKQDSIVVFGATFCIFLQAMIVILGSCNVIPFTGLPIPFLSRGFTYQTIVYCFIGIMIHMSIHKEVNEIHNDEIQIPTMVESEVSFDETTA